MQSAPPVCRLNRQTDEEVNYLWNIFIEALKLQKVSLDSSPAFYFIFILFILLFFLRERDGFSVPFFLRDVPSPPAAPGDLSTSDAGRHTRK